MYHGENMEEKAERKERRRSRSPQRRRRDDCEGGDGKDDTERREAHTSGSKVPNQEGAEVDDYAEGIDGDQRDEHGNSGEVIHTRGGEDHKKDAEQEHRRSRSPQHRWGAEQGGNAKVYGKRTEE